MATFITSNGPSSAVPAWCNGLAHSIATWNLRGALHHRREVRHRKLNALNRYALKHAVVCIQEVHGTRAEILAAFSRFARRFVIHISSCADNHNGDCSPHSGGLVTLLNKQHHIGWTSHSEELIPGRILKVVATRYPSDAKIVIPNMEKTHFSNPSDAKIVIPNGEKPHFSKFDIPNIDFRADAAASALSASGEARSGPIICIYTNIHNQNITRQQLTRFINHEKPLVQRAKSQPELCHYSLTGDFNLRPPGHTSMGLNTQQRNIISNHDSSSLPSGNPPRRPLENLWNSFLSLLTEVLDKEHTHLCIQNMSTSRIDRIFTSFPKSLLLYSSNTSGVARSPAEWLADDISDHSLAFWSCCYKSRGNDALPRLRPSWCRHPLFRTLCDFYFAAEKFGDCELHARLDMCKCVLTYCALQARNHLLHNEPLSKQSRLSTLCSAAKAVWTRDAQLAQRLCRFSQFASSHIYFATGVPCLRDPLAFDRELALSKIEYLDKVRKRYATHYHSDNSSLALRAKSKEKIDQIERQAALWRPSVSYLALAGIKIDATEGAPAGLVRDHLNMRRELTRAWSPIFSNTGMRLAEAKKLLRVYCRNVSWTWINADPPDNSIIDRTIDRALNHAPGIDGTCDAAWSCGGPTPRALVCELSADLGDGHFPPPGFNHTIFVFPPKKTGLPNDGPGGIFRKALETRPIGLKDGINKYVGGAAAHKVAASNIASTSCLQTGFVPTRNFLNNVVSIDTMSRVHAFRCMNGRGSDCFNQLLPNHSVSNLAVTALFDFSTAFPSCFHEWIFLVLDAIHAPQWFINICKNMYLDAKAYWLHDGHMSFLFDVLCGVLQGCPLSSVLFNYCIDPLLWLFSRLIIKPNLGLVRACADDLAAALSRLHTLITMQSIFALFEKVAGLKLHPSKCVIILVSTIASPSTIHRVRDWLLQHIPTWSAFRIENSGLYLGFSLGPFANHSLWSAAIKKYRGRADAIFLSGVTARIAARDYNSRAATVLSYIAQLCPLPSGFKKIELGALHKTFHLAPQSFSLRCLYDLQHICGFRVVPLVRLCSATLIRTAHANVNSIDVLFRTLKDCAMSMDELPIARRVHGPIASRLNPRG